MQEVSPAREKDELMAKLVSAGNAPSLKKAPKFVMGAEKMVSMFRLDKPFTRSSVAAKVTSAREMCCKRHVHTRKEYLITEGTGLAQIRSQISSISKLAFGV